MVPPQPGTGAAKPPTESPTQIWVADPVTSSRPSPPNEVAKPRSGTAVPGSPDASVRTAYSR